jgi:hypothetical protein
MMGWCNQTIAPTAAGRKQNPEVGQSPPTQAETCQITHPICYPKNRAECRHQSHGTYPWLFHCKSFSKTNLAASLLEIMVCGTESLNAPETGQISIVNFNRWTNLPISPLPGRI